MLSINNLSFFFGQRALYENISLHIKPKERIGLIGVNGAGKSTLLKLINGDLQPDEGDISKAKDCSLGFLNQDLLSYQSEDSILEVAMQAFERQNQLLHEINILLKKMETDYSDEIINRLAKRQEEFEALDGYSLQSKAEEILEGLGFKTEELTQPLKEFSGGWRMRVMLAKILLAKPALLLLDEPTNHLDLPSIEWMENYINNYEGAVIIVSHDRQFLNNTANRIVEVSRQNIRSFSGNYDFYMEEKQLQDEIQQNAFENQQKQIKDTERFITRFKAKATKARQVQSRVKALERMEKVEEVRDENATMHFNFPPAKQPGKIILELNDVSKAYGPKTILEKATAQIIRGDKIALIGANGKGKSTLLRIISGNEEIEGERKEGYHVQETFFAQHQLEALHIENDLLQELQSVNSEHTETELRGLLGCFLFSDDDIFKKIKVLSGGEKSRVALAKTLLSEANFLLLDEPTNHLDIPSVNMLVQAIQQYQGTCVIVSHDRHFIRQVANKIWFIEDHQIKEYPGTYEEYLIWMKNREAQATKPVEAPKPVKQEKKKPETDAERNARRQLENQLKKLKNELQKAEQSVEELEGKKAVLEDEMAKPSVYGNPDLLAEKTQAFDKLNGELEEANEAWEGLMMEVEEIEEQL